MNSIRVFEYHFMEIIYENLGNFVGRKSAKINDNVTSKKSDHLFLHDTCQYCCWARSVGLQQCDGGDVEANTVGGQRIVVAE